MDLFIWCSVLHCRPSGVFTMWTISTVRPSLHTYSFPFVCGTFYTCFSQTSHSWLYFLCCRGQTAVINQVYTCVNVRVYEKGHISSKSLHFMRFDLSFFTYIILLCLLLLQVFLKFWMAHNWIIITTNCSTFNICMQRVIKRVYYKICHKKARGGGCKLAGITGLMKQADQRIHYRPQVEQTTDTGMRLFGPVVASWPGFYRKSDFWMRDR